MVSTVFATMAFDVKVREPNELCAVLGANTIGREQVAPAASVVMQDDADGILKAEPEIWIALMVKGPVPQFVTVRVSCMEVPRVAI
jgi:hypothetical protein